MFDGFQPIVLKARTAPKVLSKPSICERASADSEAVLRAATVTPAALTGAPWIEAFAPASTTLVTMTAP